LYIIIVILFSTFFLKVTIIRENLINFLNVKGIFFIKFKLLILLRKRTKIMSSIAKILIQPTDSLREFISIVGSPLTQPKIITLNAIRLVNAANITFPSFTLQIPNDAKTQNGGYIGTVGNGLPKLFRHNEPLPINFDISGNLNKNGTNNPVVVKGFLDRRGNLIIAKNEQNDPLDVGIYDFTSFEVSYLIRNPRLIKGHFIVNRTENIIVDLRQSNALLSQGGFPSNFDYGEYSTPYFIGGEFGFVWPANNVLLPNIKNFPRMDMFFASYNEFANNIQLNQPTTNVSASDGTQAEGGVATNPLNLSNKVSVYQNRTIDRNGFFRSYTFDGGKNWTTERIATGDNPSVPRGGSDPHVRFDNFGNCWVLYLAPVDPLNLDVPPIRQILLLSIDGGQTLNQVDEISDPNWTFPPIFGIDFGWLATGPDKTGKNQVVWHGGSFTQVNANFESQFLSYRMRGTTVTGLGVYNNTFSQFDIPLDNAFSFPAFDIGVNGEIFLVFQSLPADRVLNGRGFNAGTRIYVPLVFVKVVDPFNPNPSTPKIITIQNGGFPKDVYYSGEVGTAIPAQIRRGLLAIIQVVVDKSSSNNRGRIYVSYCDEIDPIARPGPMDVLVLWSDDGDFWSPILKINNNINPASAFLPGMAVDNINGKVGITWLDTRADPIIQRTRPYVTIFETAQLIGNEKNAKLQNHITNKDDYDWIDYMENFAFFSFPIS
jgi:hypothetical protein